MVSFDVESLFTNVPIEGAVQAALRKLESDPTLADRTTETELTAFCNTSTADHPLHHGNREWQQDRLSRRVSFKRTRRPPYHQRLQEANSHRSILSVWFTPSSISKTRYCEVSVRPGETSRDQTVSHLRRKETLVICACLQRISLPLCAEDQQSKNSPQERAHGRIQIHRRFTLRSGSIGASSPLPRTTRQSHRLQIRNDTKVTFGATLRHRRPG